MARPMRIEYEGAFYHVTSRGNERKEIFRGSEDYERFKHNLNEAQDKYNFLLHEKTPPGVHLRNSIFPGGGVKRPLP